jgi:hypothetical protein
MILQELQEFHFVCDRPVGPGWLHGSILPPVLNGRGMGILGRWWDRWCRIRARGGGMAPCFVLIFLTMVVTQLGGHIRSHRQMVNNLATIWLQSGQQSSL